MIAQKAHRDMNRAGAEAFCYLRIIEHFQTDVNSLFLIISNRPPDRHEVSLTADTSCGDSSIRVSETDSPILSGYP